MFHSIFLNSIIYILLVTIMSGCSPTTKIEVPKNGMTVIDYGADRRGAYIYVDEKGKLVIVSEPSPDIAKELTSSLGLSAKTLGELEGAELKASYANNVVNLASRSQTLQVLRESMFRLSEMGASSNMSTGQRVELYQKVLDTILAISLTEFANSNAPNDAKSAVLKRFLSNTEQGTVNIPDENNSSDISSETVKVFKQ